MELTIINHDVGRSVVGYMVNAIPNEDNRRKISHIQQRLERAFGEAIWNTPEETLHITLLDWLAPLVDYEDDKEKLFRQIFNDYDQVLADILKDEGPIKVRFDSVRVGPAAVFAVGKDDGTIQRIRERFLERVDLLPNTKLPPTIIHSTIARFQKEQPLQPIIDHIAQEELVFDDVLTSFRLIKEKVTPQLEVELIKEYPLNRSDRI